MKNLVIHGIQCPTCKTVIFSRATHDYRGCPCGEVAIDGGRDYTRVAYKTKHPPHVALELIGLTEADLFNDWNMQKNKFGLVRTKHFVYDVLFRYTYNRNGKLYRYPKSS